MSNEDFDLLGHDNPLGYPAPVVPVGQLDNCLVAVYASDRATAISLEDDEQVFVLHDESLRETLKGFDYLNERLFALNSESVSSYSIDYEAEYFAQLLQDHSFSGDNPFMRLALAKGTKKVSLILLELGKCIVRLLETAPNFTSIWYERQVYTLTQQLDPIEQVFIPETWALLLDISRDEFPGFDWIQPEIDSEYRYVADQELVESRTTVDVVIITTFAEEHDAIISKLPSVQRVVPGTDNFRAYFRSEVPITSEDQTIRSTTIGVVYLPEMGRSTPVGAVRDVIRILRPQTVIWVGIAAGVANNGVGLGDVLISNQIVNYELRKNNINEDLYRVHHLERNVFSAAQNLGTMDWLRLIQAKRPVEGNPKHIAGPLAIGVSPPDSDEVRKLMSRWPELIGLVSEGNIGVSVSQQVGDDIGFLTIRGVCDLADQESDSESSRRWRRYAFDVAASYAIALLRNGLIAPINVGSSLNISSPPAQESYELLEIKDTAALHSEDLDSLMQLANTYLSQKRSSEAADVLRRVLLLEPHHIDARVQLGKVYRQQRDWAEAEEILLEALRYDAGVLEARTELSKLYQHQHRWEDAETILLESLKVDSHQPNARVELGKIYQRQRRWRDAEAILLESLKIDPEQLQVRTELSKIHQRQHRWQDAEAILLESLRIDPDQLQVRAELSKIYQYQHRWQDAEAILLESLRIDPDQLQVRAELSKIYRHQHRWPDAEAILLESLKIDPDGVQVRTELSKIYQRAHRWRDAEEILYEALRIDPTYLDSRLELGRIFRQQKRWKEAEEILAGALRIDPTHLDSRLELSKIFRRQERLKDAEEMLLEASAIDSSDLQIRRELSSVYAAEAKFSQAESVLRESLLIAPNDIHLSIDLGKIYAKEAKYEEAEHLFKRVLQIDATNISARLALASLYFRTKRYADREGILFEIYEIAPEDVMTLTALAQVFKRFKKFRVALQLLTRALAVRNSDLYIVGEIIELYARLRDKKNVEHYAAVGRQILEGDQSNRFRERFAKLRTDVDENITLLDLNAVGVFVRANSQQFLEQGNIRFRVIDSGTVNYRVKANERVFFAMYKFREEIVADFLEPFFEDITRLRDLR